MDDQDWLAGRFEDHRARLRSVAFRMLGSLDEADDAVQETWIRLSRTDSGTVQNLGGWLTTVVARVSLDMLRTRRSRLAEPTNADLSDHAAHIAGEDDPERDAILADSVGSALLVVLDALSAAERLAFVLHDTFGVPHEQIGEILGRSTNAAKQLASRARLKVRGSDPVDGGDVIRQRHVIEAFLAASRNGDFEALVALLEPDVVLDADAAAVRMGVAEKVIGASAVAATFSGRAQGARPALIGGTAGIVWAVGGRLKVIWDFTITLGKIAHIDMLAEPDHLNDVEVHVLD